MTLESMKGEMSSLLGSVADGWRHLRETAANALTRFKSSESSRLPERSEIDDPSTPSAGKWSLLGGELFEDAHRIVVRLEVPGMDKRDMDIQIVDGSLVLKGEKRFSGESSNGRWRIMQCAYGSFRRVVPLSAPVSADDAKATYRDGVLRVELKKLVAGTPKARTIRVS